MITLRSLTALPVLGAAVAIAIVTVGGCGARERTLHVFVWSDYLVPELVQAFEKEAHCRVETASFESNEEMRAKLLAGDAGFDLVCPSDYMVVQLVKDGLLDTIDAARVPNVKNLSPRFAAPEFDPHHEHAIPYQWGLTGIVYRKSEVKDPPRSWKDFFDEKRMSAWKGRVSMLDDMRELAGAALLALGHSPNTRDEKEIAAAHDLLVRQKPFVAKYTSSGFADSLVAKETVIAHGWSGDAASAQKEDDDIAFVVPEEGTLTYVDNWAIVKGAPEKALAESFIDYLLRGDVAAKSVNAKRYASVNEAAKSSIDPAILAGTAYEDGHGKHLYWVEDVGPAAAAYARLYADLKTQ